MMHLEIQNIVTKRQMWYGGGIQLPLKQLPDPVSLPKSELDVKKMIMNYKIDNSLDSNQSYIQVQVVVFSCFECC